MKSIPHETTSERYRRYATFVARAESSLFGQLTIDVAHDAELLVFLDSLPEPKRHPQLFFGAVRYHGAAPETCEELRLWVNAHRALLTQTMLQRNLQLNDPGRCSPVLPLLAMLPQPIALLEVGASAGLCLYPDHYGYEFGSRHVGDRSSVLQLSCPVSGAAPIPDGVPRIAWRAGIDLNPLDPMSDDDVRWLEALCWPGPRERLDRVRAAISVARRERCVIVRGDLNAKLREMAAQAPRDATLVIVHSATLSYVGAERRCEFVRQVQAMKCHWISQELPYVFPDITRRIEPGPYARYAAYVVALDGLPVALSAMNGASLLWLEPSLSGRE